MPRLSKIGAAALAAFGWTSGSSVTASYLVVAGGGGGGYDVGGGGGAGGYQASTVSLNPTLSYTVTVGSGGAGAVSSVNGTNGSSSQFGSLTASVGGGGGASASNTAGSSGGSGGGGTRTSAAGGSATSGQGNAGGSGSPSSGANVSAAGGGGGAGAVGANATNGAGGAGGAGTASSISGSSVTYAGGGGGRADGTGTQGAGGSGGGGAAGSTGTAGTANTGGGGGGASTSGGGNGGSGIVIISYAGAQQFGGGVVTTDGTNTIHTFTTSGTLSPITPLSASYLVVAGGGGGSGGNGGSPAAGAGGGGAGGYRTATATIDTNSIYVVTVGAGGVGGVDNGLGVNGSNSVFLSTTSTGGGRGGSTGGVNGATGGSGGGGQGKNSGAGGAGNTPSTSPSQGSNGGAGGTSVGGGGGGGGGASATGTTATSASGGAGGAGTASSLSGASVTYAGGGGGGNQSSGSGGSGGTGGGGAGGTNAAGTAATANTGGGGGGGGVTASNQGFAGGAGGSGVVIISYPGSTQQMAGGTVTITGGNVIHTFTSSGYLTPLKLVNNSLRFRSSASAYLNRTTGTPTNANIWTWSAWVKRGTLTTRNTLFCGGSTNVNYIGFGDSASTDNFGLSYANTPSQLVNVQSTAVYRDPSAWYHFMVVYDSTSATSTITGSSTDRVRLYVNGVQITSFTATTPPSQNTSVNINTASAVLNIGRRNIASPDGYFDGYLTEINFIDGQALTPNSFGTINSYGVWQPITYGGSYGTNGFYLPFTNKTSTTTLGYDFSPNGNNWTTNNISLTAGTTYDSMTDVPTLTSATAANFAVPNPLIPTSLTYSNGNLTTSNATASWYNTRATMPFPSTGKFYYEQVCTSGVNCWAGVGNENTLLSGNPAGYDANSYGYGNNGQKFTNSTGSAYGSSFTTNDVIGVAFDSATGSVWFAKNGVWQNSGVPASGTGYAFTGITGTIFPIMSSSGSGATVVQSYNFGQQPFTYTPPTGFVALNTYNL